MQLEGIEGVFTDIEAHVDRETGFWPFAKHDNRLRNSGVGGTSPVHITAA